MGLGGPQGTLSQLLGRDTPGKLHLPYPRRQEPGMTPLRTFWEGEARPETCPWGREKVVSLPFHSTSIYGSQPMSKIPRMYHGLRGR